VKCGKVGMKPTIVAEVRAENWESRPPTALPSALGVWRSRENLRIPCITRSLRSWTRERRRSWENTQI
jgi:hypothetical protein